MPRRSSVGVQISRGQSRILSGIGEALSYAMQNGRNRRAMSQGSENLAGALEDGVDLELDEGRISLVRRRPNPKRVKGSRRG